MIKTASSPCGSHPWEPSDRRRDRGWVGSATILIVLVGLLLAVEPVLALVVEYPTSDPTRKLRLVLTNNPGGLALDAAGNIYYTDQGDGSPGSGSIRMIPEATMVPMTIITGLDRPGDVEVTPDGRALVFANGDSKVSRRFFGLSVSFRSTSGLTIPGLTMYLDRPGLGITKGYQQIIDDFYVIPDVLVPELTGTQADLIVEFPTGKTLRFPLDLRAPDHDKPSGQIIKFFVVAN